MVLELSVLLEVPVYAFAEDMATSGGYFVMCAAREIYATEVIPARKQKGS